MKSLSASSTSFRNWLAERVGSKRYRFYRVRLLVQATFVAVCVLTGWQFSRFYLAARAGDVPLPPRPPGVEGFLPISGLMGVFDWWYQGALNRIHPAATIIVLLVLAIALLLRKSFCSWICPVGSVSESLARLGRHLFGRNFRIWRPLDIALQGLKYALLLFFLQAIVRMSAASLRGFIESPYNRVADVKMGLFFVDLGQVGLSVMLVLVFGSVLIQGFWCRYLCPYGALLGLVSWISPVQVKRREDLCIDCRLCDQVCMARLPVSRLRSVRSVECTGCVDCLAVCPVPDALGLTMMRKKLSVPRFALLIVGLFMTGYLVARASGFWDNAIGDQEYVQRIQRMGSPTYAHPGGVSEIQPTSR